MGKFIDLLGQKFNHLTVIDKAPRNKSGQIQWACSCDCGSDKIVYATATRLKRGAVKSCGCIKTSKYKTRLVGKRFGKLTAIECVGKYKNTNAYAWHCKCDCGNDAVVKASSLLNGTTKSCGCLLDEYQQRRASDYTGFDNGDMTVLKRLGTMSTGSVAYLCKCHHCGNEFTVTDHALRQNCVHSCGCTYGSSEEQEIVDFIKGIRPDIAIRRSERIGETKKEMDIYLPDYNLGIEYNGSTYHATLGNKYTPKHKSYHFDKFILAREQGIHLINIFDFAWHTNKKKIEAYIKSLLVPCDVVYARNTEVKSIEKEVAMRFLDDYHIQGRNYNSEYHYGIYYNSELLSVMTFGKVRYSTGMELIRYACKDGISVIGGASKLFKHFLSDTGCAEVLTYSDNNYFLGSVYPKLGFTFDGYTQLSYYWYLHKKYYSREKCQPKILKEKYPDLYNPEARSIENDIMLKLGGSKVYMCGNSRWVYRCESKKHN